MSPAHFAEDTIPDMSSDLPNTGQVRIRVLQVNTLTRGEVMHDVKARILPRVEGAKPVHVSIRDENCPRPPVSGDRLKLTMQAGQVAGVEVLKPSKVQPSGDDSGNAD